MSQFSTSGKNETFPPAGTKMLLHSCCAPCSGSMIKVLFDKGIHVTVLWYNPNIHPRSEYEIRKDENKRYAIELGIPFVDLDYDVTEWLKRARGMEYDLERGRRCTMCFDMRMERTVLYAIEYGFPLFTTTNATSRWKDEKQVNESGHRAAARYASEHNVRFWEHKWQTDELTLLKYQVSAQQRFYKQEYCGCMYSLRDTNLWRKQNGEAPVQIGGGGVFSDPTADAAEESQDLVDEFFRSADQQFDDDRRALLYEKRKKNVVSISYEVESSESADTVSATVHHQSSEEPALMDLNNW